MRDFVLYLGSLFNVCVLEDSWALRAASTFNLLSYVVLNEGYKNLALHTCVVRSGGVF